MSRRTALTRRSLVGGLAGAAVTSIALPAAASERGGAGHRTLRFMTCNASLNRGSQGQLVRDLSTPGNAQAQAVAEVIQRCAPDVLLINEFDYDAEHLGVQLFRDNYLARSQNGQAPLDFPHAFTAAVNTGVDSGLDLNGDGTLRTGDDAWGFGLFPGQYGMAVYSTAPIDHRAVRTFQLQLWSQMPDSLLPWDYYGREIGKRLRLSSKSHWDVPVRVGRDTVHVLASHPTPPSFDGSEDRNGRRNHDEIRFWADYITGSRRGSWICDDNGGTGGLMPGSCWSTTASRIPGRARRGPSRRLPPREGPTRGIWASTASTRRTSPTRRRATCGWTTSCRRRISGCRTPRCSGPHRGSPARSSRARIPSRPRTIGPSGRICACAESWLRLPVSHQEPIRQGADGRG